MEFVVIILKLYSTFDFLKKQIKYKGCFRCSKNPLVEYKSLIKLYILT